MQNNCISAKNFEENCTIYSVSKPVKILMGSNTGDVVDSILIQLYQNSNKQ